MISRETFSPSGPNCLETYCPVLNTLMRGALLALNLKSTSVIEGHKNLFLVVP